MNRIALYTVTAIALSAAGRASAQSSNSFLNADHLSGLTLTQEDPKTFRLDVSSAPTMSYLGVTYHINSVFGLWAISGRRQRLRRDLRLRRLGRQRELRGRRAASSAGRPTPTRASPPATTRPSSSTASPPTMSHASASTSASRSRSRAAATPPTSLAPSPPQERLLDADGGSRSVRHRWR